MDRRVFAAAMFCVLPAAFAPDFRWQVAFAALGVAIAFAGVVLWRLDPYFIDSLQVELSLPHGGPADNGETYD